MVRIPVIGGHSESINIETHKPFQIEEIKKILRELNDFEHETLYPLANEKIEIDLDYGVKVNYNKFGSALKKVEGLSAK